MYMTCWLLRRRVAGCTGLSCIFNRIDILWTWWPSKDLQALTIDSRFQSLCSMAKTVVFVVYGICHWNCQQFYRANPNFYILCSFIFCNLLDFYLNTCLFCSILFYGMGHRPAWIFQRLRCWQRGIKGCSEPRGRLSGSSSCISPRERGHYMDDSVHNAETTDKKLFRYGAVLYTSFLEFSDVLCFLGEPSFFLPILLWCYNWSEKQFHVL